MPRVFPVDPQKIEAIHANGNRVRSRQHSDAPTSSLHHNLPAQPVAANESLFRHDEVERVAEDIRTHCDILDLTITELEQVASYHVRRVEEETAELLKNAALALTRAPSIRIKTIGYAIAFAIGFDEVQGMKQTTVARHLGLKKQQLNAAVNSVADAFGPRTSVCLRTDQARRHMAESYQRRHS